MKDCKQRQHTLYIEPVKLQKEVIASDLTLLVIAEGRDPAGIDSTIKKTTKHLSLRETILALGKPSDTHLREWYFQRYTAHIAVSGQLTYLLNHHQKKDQTLLFFDDGPVYSATAINVNNKLL
ncbi:hypothetical protein [Dyadobacter sp. 3J3]|uniref:hypothetical protein n=1 Tax=Dyadobacter sp. 3J3 TaxID=2606600 RepID=UPI00135C626B|nr:hypothetical protein [Dyadobacter sp. 3J3]